MLPSPTKSSIKTTIEMTPVIRNIVLDNMWYRMLTTKLSVRIVSLKRLQAGTCIVVCLGNIFLLRISF